MHLRVGNISHCSMSEKNNNKGSISDSPNDKDQEENDRDDIRLRSVFVWCIGNLCSIWSSRIVSKNTEEAIIVSDI